jgi:hypothetical protein
MKTKVSTGITDAKGEKTRFQGKRAFFHWELLFFQREKALRLLWQALGGAFKRDARATSRA